jgi:hypothetical protein
MKSHIMTSMSASYDPVVLKYRGELAETPLVKLKKEISLQYKALVKAGSKNKSESALVANVNKHPYKKFKAPAGIAARLDTKRTKAAPPKPSWLLDILAKLRKGLTRQMSPALTVRKKGIMHINVQSPRRTKLQTIWLCSLVSLQPTMKLK